MSRYDWPDVPRPEEHDDPGRRGRFMARRRTDFDPEGALAAGRRAPAPRPGRPGAPRAPASGREYLWQPLGPMTVVGGQAVGTPRIAGRVNALAVDPTGERLYAASGNGGIWYSGDAGASWRSLGGFAPTDAAAITRPAHRNACGTVFVRFGATAALDDVWVGTGETAHAQPDAQPGISLGGVGVLFARGPAASAADDPWKHEAKSLLGKGINRFAVSPDGTTVVAATTDGLVQRPAAEAAAVASWPRVASTPFDTVTEEVTDVLWTPADAASSRPARLWAWVRGGANGGLWVRADGQANFTRVATATTVRRGVLAASTPADQIYVLVDAGQNVVPFLFRVAAAGAAAPAATQVAGVPNLFQKQGFYDIALAVHPAMPDRLVLGGCTFRTTLPDGGTARDGAVLLGDVAMNAGTLTFGHPTPFTMIGVGVHSDVHAVVYSKGGDRLWAGCDGGVYRSDHPTKSVGFVPCNTGLSIVESNYVASHPTCEGHVVTGLQDNGVIVRLSNGVWRNAGLGDGGGVTFDPVRPDRFVRQHFQGFWSSSDGSLTGEELFTRGTTKAWAEHNAAAFYSMPAAIGHRRGVAATAAPNVGQIILGTDRVWYTESFGASWVTLPTGTDPLPADLTQDGFGQSITVCRWQSPDVAWVLGEGTLKWYGRAVGSDAAGGPGTWLAVPVLGRTGKDLAADGVLATEARIRKAAVWTDIAVNLEPPPSAGQPPAVRGSLGALYLGTIGDPADALVDTLWWFDGTSAWHPTGLRTDPLGVPAPVTAIACDPAFPNEVWVGTTVGVWYGKRKDNGAAPPTWEWQTRVNGLPEAAVEDLSLFSDGGLVLLRAAIASRGVWELRLDVATVEDATYLRAHDDDLRHRSRAVETKRDLVTPRSWHGSPDVRPRRAAAPRAAPSSLPWWQVAPGDREGLRRFQAALRSKTGDARVRATGTWDVYFNEVMRDLGAPLAAAPMPPNIVRLTTAFWNTHMVGAHASAEPWGAGAPSEADLHELVAPLPEGDLAQASCEMPARKLKVDVVVHHRGLQPTDGAGVRVTLLRWIDPKAKGAAQWNDHTTWFAGDVAWTPAVNQVLDSADGKSALPVDAGWKFVLGAAGQSRRLTLAGQTLDPTHPGIATFDLDLTGVKPNTLMLLVAVIHTPAGPDDHVALAPATLRELALARRNVAVRSVRVGG